MVGGFAAGLFWRQIAEGANDHSRAGEASKSWRAGRVVHQFGLLGCQAEVEDFEPAVARQEEVLGLDVTVSDALVMRRSETLGDSARVLGGFADSDGPSPESSTKGLALENLRDNVVLLVLLAGVVHGEDVRVRESGDGLSFLMEACQAVAIIDQAFWEELDRHLSAEPGVTARNTSPIPPLPIWPRIS